MDNENTIPTSGGFFGGFFQVHLDNPGLSAKTAITDGVVRGVILGGTIAALIGAAALVGKLTK